MGPKTPSDLDKQLATPQRQAERVAVWECTDDSVLCSWACSQTARGRSARICPLWHTPAAWTLPGKQPRLACVGCPVFPVLPGLVWVQPALWLTSAAGTPPGRPCRQACGFHPVLPAFHASPRPAGCTKPAGTHRQPALFRGLPPCLCFLPCAPCIPGPASLLAHAGSTGLDVPQASISQCARPCCLLDSPVSPGIALKSSPSAHAGSTDLDAHQQALLSVLGHAACPAG